MRESPHHAKIQPIVGVQGRVSPSAARALSDLETDDLRATALALPDGWVVALIPPYGQVVIEPRANRHRYHRCWVGDRVLGRLYRDVA